MPTPARLMPVLGTPLIFAVRNRSPTSPAVAPSRPLAAFTISTPWLERFTLPAVLSWVLKVLESCRRMVAAPA